MKPIQIIAEAGVNHNGDIETAKALIREAARAGADYVKFQTFRAGELAAGSAPQAEYQKKTASGYVSQLEMLQALELPYSAHAALIEECERCGVGFVSAPFDLQSAAFLDKLHLPFWKIPSGEITNYPLLVRIARTGKRAVLSTGMSTLTEVSQALALLKEHGSGEVTLLHCNTQYPTPYEDVNLRAMLTMRERFGVPVGYSDHTPGMEIPVAAAALGATVLEKHFTLSRAMPGPDHRASLEPDELAEMIRMIRRVERALGSAEKAPSPSEAGNLYAVRKSIVAARPIRAGELLTEENLAAKRPGGGLSPMRWPDAVGRRASKDFEANEAIVL